MKQFIYILFLTLLFTGCAQDTSPKVTWWVPNWDEPVARRLANEFMEANPDVEVELVITTWDTMADKIRVSLMSGYAPDLITELTSRTAIYASRGLLLNLQDYFDADFEYADFMASALEAGSFNDSLYAIPFRHDAIAVYYNRKLFREAGLNPDQPPATWNEFVNISRQLTQDTDGDGINDQFGMAWPLGNQANAVQRFISQLYTRGGQLIDQDSRQCLLNSPEAIRAMRDITDGILVDNYAPLSSLEMDNTSLRELLLNDRVAMNFSGPYDVELIEASPDFELGTALLPGIKGPGIPTSDGFALLIPESAKHKELAWKLLKHIARPENMAAMTATFPARLSATGDERFSHPLKQPFLEQIQYSRPMPQHPRWPEIERIIFLHMQRILLELSDVETALDAATREINAIIE